ncbi:MAG: YicC family protein [Phycisphaerales bacterium]|nr:YicC family protein [Phycisphaerales bacterium]
MIRSMTGFGEASSQVNGVHFFVELRSLNNKYFKAVIRLPETLQVLEAELESLLRRRISRGTVTLTASCTDSSESAALDVNHRALDRYVEQLRRVKAVAAGELQIDVGSLLGLPGVLQPPADEEDRLLRARGEFSRLTDLACDHAISMRRREGAMLEEELRRHAGEIGERLGRIAARAPQVIQDYEARLRQRIDSMLEAAGVKVEPVELIRELATYAERTDIAEEVARLSAHIDQFGDLLGAPDDQPVGRTLDFLAQEMLREANTIASKSSDALISRLIVEIKGLIDRIKEQVQNVE